MTRPLPAHGTYARAVGTRSGSRLPCQCPPCKQELLRRQKGYRCGLYRHATPQEISRAAAHLAHLQESDDFSLRKFCDQAQVSAHTALRVIRGERVRLSTVNRILAVREQTIRFGGDHVPGIGSQRKVRGLFALGHTYLEMGVETELSWQTLRLVAEGEHLAVRLDTAERIDELYRRWSMTLGPSKRNRTVARERGWGQPLHWDDIDDPDAFPDLTGHCGTPSGWLLHHAAAENPCGPCSGHAIDMKDRPHVRLFVITYQGAIEALQADGWTWTRIGKLVHAKPDFVRDEYRKHTKDQMGVAA